MARNLLQGAGIYREYGSESGREIYMKVEEIRHISDESGVMSGVK